MGMLRSLLLLAAIPIVAGAQERSLDVAGTTRSYVIHLPRGTAPAKPAPLVLMFHGGGGNAANAARTSGFDAKSDKEGLIVVYPNGIAPRPGMRAFFTWNAGRCCGPAMERKVDDVAFVRALVEAVAKEYPVDRKRIYATGMSNGGMFAYRLACEMSDVFAAVAPVAGALNYDGCKPAARVSVIAFHGKADDHVLFNGGEPKVSVDKHKRIDNSVAFAMDFWTKVDGCDAKPSRDAKGSVAHDTWKCADGTAVELYAIEGQGHSWPASATDLMWTFFARHQGGPR